MQTYITSIGTANPSNRFRQADIAGFMSKVLELNAEETRQLNILYRATGIQYRYSLISDYDKIPENFQFYPNEKHFEPFPSTSKRMQLYKEKGLDVMLEAVHECFRQRESVDPGDITHLILVSCTGMYAPGPDIQLIEKLGLRSNVKRTSINFMGCYAAFNAIKTASAFAATDQDARVLVVCAEFCSLHLQKSKLEDHLISGSLFGDGAAALLVENEPAGQRNLALEADYCDLLWDGGDNMAWEIGDFGFEMRLSSYVPDLIDKGILQLTQNLLRNLNVPLESIDHFAIHPGGKKIVQRIEEALFLPKEKTKPTWEVLREYGNMSSPTILFVLKKILERGNKSENAERIMAFAFGPGLTLESLLFKKVE